MGERWRQFKFDLTSKWALAVDKDSVDDTICEKYDISNKKWAQFCQSCRDPLWEVSTLWFSLFSTLNSLIIIHCNHEFHQCSIFAGCAKKGIGHPEAKHCPHVLSRGDYEYLEKKLMDEKTNKKLEEAAQSGSTDTVIDPSSPIRRYVKWKMARTKKTGQMTFEAAKEITDKIVSHFQLIIVIIYVYCVIE